MRVVTCLKNVVTDNEWPTQCDICCWWCCNTFETMPCPLPTKYDPLRKRFTFMGIFCSWNCSKAYNLSMIDYKRYERNEYITMLLQQLYGIENAIKVKPAPPRETLKMFGGYLSIDEFRENSYKNEKTYMVVKPPLISIIPKIEENIATSNKNLKNNFPLVNENILNKTQSTLKLKRNKPVTNPNSTLQSFMDLKIS
jgi:hypothetical protein